MLSREKRSFLLCHKAWLEHAHRSQWLDALHVRQPSCSWQMQPYAAIQLFTCAFGVIYFTKHFMVVGLSPQPHKLVWQTQCFVVPPAALQDCSCHLGFTMACARLQLPPGIYRLYTYLTRLFIARLHAQIIDSMWRSMH